MEEYKVGDEVGYGFNGDRHSAGKIVRMTKNYIWTEHGHKFTKIGEHYRMTGTKCWWMSKGAHEYLNPHF
jgi:hypothetical protein